MQIVDCRILVDADLRNVAMDGNELKERTKKFALRVIKLVESLPKTTTGRVLGNQLIRSGTSVAANYRAACRARTKAEFVSKIGIVIEEADESVFWLELVIDSKLMRKELIKSLLDEASEITAIMVSSNNTARKRKA